MLALANDVMTWNRRRPRAIVPGRLRPQRAEAALGEVRKRGDFGFITSGDQVEKSPERDTLPCRRRPLPLGLTVSCPTRAARRGAAARPDQGPHPAGTEAAPDPSPYLPLRPPVVDADDPALV